MGKIPDRWREYSPLGRQVHHSRLIALKVPLKESIVQSLPPSERFTPAMLLRTKPDIGLIIDLTMTNRYYDPKEIVQTGRMYAKIPCPGQRLPGEPLVLSFFATIDHYLELHKDDRTLIGIHCTHGVNRTGYMIGRYLMQRMRIPCDQAINAVSEARGHSIERPPYITDLTTKAGSYLPPDLRNSALGKDPEIHTKDMRQNWRKPRKDEAASRQNQEQLVPKDPAKQMDWHSRQNIPGPSREFRDRVPGPGWNRKPSNDLAPPSVHEPSYEMPVKHHIEKMHDERSRAMLRGERNRDVNEARYRFEESAAGNFIEIPSHDQHLYGTVPPPPEIRNTDTYGAPPTDWAKKDMREYPTWAGYRQAEEVDMNRKHPIEPPGYKDRISPEVRRKSRENLDVIPVNARNYQVDNRQRLADLEEEARKYRRREEEFVVRTESRKTDQGKPFLGPREPIEDARADRRPVQESFRGREVVHHQREPQRDEPRFKRERSREPRILEEELPQRFTHDRGFPTYEEPCYETEEVSSVLPPEGAFIATHEAELRLRKDRARFMSKEDDYIPRERENFIMQKETEQLRYQESSFDAIRKREFTQRKEKEDLHLLPVEYNKRNDDFRVKVKSDQRIEERRSTRATDDFELNHAKDPSSRNLYNPRRDEFKQRDEDMWIAQDGMGSSKSDDFRTIKHVDLQVTSPEKSFPGSKRRNDLKRERDHFVEDVNLDSRRRANARDAIIDDGEEIDRIVHEHPELHESRGETKKSSSRRRHRVEPKDASLRRRRISPDKFAREETYGPPAPRELHERARHSFDILRTSQSPQRRVSPRRRFSPRRLSSSRSPIRHRMHEGIHLSAGGRSRSPIDYYRISPPLERISSRRRRSRSPLRGDLSPSTIQDRLREVEEKLRRVEKGEIELSRRRSLSMSKSPPLIKPVHNERDCRQILNQKRSASRKIVHEESPPRVSERMERRRRSPSPFRPRKPVFNRLDRKRI